jgi:menaquinone-dependent protoporphyrinogen oxidase
MVTVLVAYGSKRGSTREIAQAVGEALADEGLEVDVVAAGEVRDLVPYESVVLGGALYMCRWHPDARRFARRLHLPLREGPVWLFSTAPLDGSADERDIPPVGFVSKVMVTIGAKGHATFGGRLAADATGFPASAMAKKMAGDFRNFDRIRDWSRGIARALIPTTATA